MHSDDIIQNPSEEQLEKLEKLKAYIASCGSLAVGFSAGVDSTFLLSVAHEVLGDKVIAVTESFASVPEKELSEAKSFCMSRGIRHFICCYDPMELDAFRYNAPDRCYHCKKGIFTEMGKIAEEQGVSVIAEGSNMDDLGDYRPGMKAIEELGIVSPLRHAGLYKSDIRALSKMMGLPTWNKPSYACLASRFEYGEEITEEKLRMVDSAEQFLISLGFTQERVRVHGSIARIEVPAEDITRLAGDDIRSQVYRRLKELGFAFVTIDMLGYRTGNMNYSIKTKEK